MSEPAILLNRDGTSRQIRISEPRPTLEFPVLPETTELEESDPSELMPFRVRRYRRWERGVVAPYPWYYEEVVE